MPAPTNTPVTPLPTVGDNLVGTPNTSYVNLSSTNVPGNTTPNIIGNSAVAQPPPTANVNATQVSSNLGSQQTPSASTSAPTTSSVSPAQVQNLAMQILQAGGGLQNPLNSYFQVQPVFKLFMTQDIDPFTALSTSNAQNGVTSQTTSGTANPQIYQTLQNMKQVVLAQTGVTGYNIKSVEINSIISPNDITKMVNTTTFTITIAESMTIGFQESILAAAQSLGVQNYLKSYFYLQLSFIAYDAAGNIVTDPVSPGLGIPNLWIWQIAITDIDVHLDAGGGTYTLSCISYAQKSYDDEIFQIPDNITVSGTTLGAITQSLTTALNQSWKFRYQNQVTNYGPTPGTSGSSAFVWHPINETLQGNFAAANDPSQYKTTFDQANFNSIQGQSITTAGVPSFLFQSGTSIQAFINAIILNSPDCQALGKDCATTGQTPGNTPGFRKSIVWRIEPDISLTAFETFTQQYYRTVTYHIRPYYTQEPIPDTQTYTQASKQGVAFQAIQDLVKQGLLVKRYDYIYTGLNIDVIDFDIKFNYSWDAVVSRFSGALTNQVQIAPPPQLANASNTTVNQGPAYQQAQNQSSVNQVALQTAQTNYNNAVAALNNAQQTPVSSTGTTASTTPNLAQLQNNVNTASSNLAQAKFNAGAAPLPQVQQNGGSTIYAETLITNTGSTNSSGTTGINSSTQSALPVSTKQGYRAVYDQAGQGTIQDQSVDKSVFSAVMAQLYTPISAKFQNITFTIRGDPYWLGETDLIRSSVMRNKGTSPKNVPKIFTGDNVFVFSFRFPVSQNNDFTPNFRSSEVFNGIYNATQVKSIFDGNGFRQEITAVKYPLIDVLQAATNGGTPTNNPVGDQNSNPAPNSNSAAFTQTGTGGLSSTGTGGLGAGNGGLGNGSTIKGNPLSGSGATVPPLSNTGPFSPTGGSSL